MTNGEKLDTTTTVIEAFEATVNGKYYGDASVFEIHIHDIRYIYVVEYSSYETGCGIEHKTFNDKDKAIKTYNKIVKGIKKSIIDNI